MNGERKLCRFFTEDDQKIDRKKLFTLPSLAELPRFKGQDLKTLTIISVTKVGSGNGVVGKKGQGFEA
jgi:hypothetical protein